MAGTWGLREKLRSALATFKAFSIKTDPSGSLAFGIDVEPGRGRVNTGALALDLSELAFDLAESARDLGTGRGLDRRNAGPEQGRVGGGLHRSTRDGSAVGPFFVVGAGLPSLPGVLAEAKSYAERLFAYRPIGPLDADAAALAVSRPAEVEGAAGQMERCESS